MLERSNVCVMDQIKELLNSFPVDKRQQILVVLKQVFSELDDAADPVVAA